MSQIRLRSDEQGTRLLNKEWPNQTWVSLELLVHGGLPFISVGGELVRVEVANGFGEYLIVGWHPSPRCALQLQLLHSKLKTAALSTDSGASDGPSEPEEEG